MNDLLSSLSSIPTLASPVLLLYLLVVCAVVLPITCLLIKSINAALSATDPARAEQARLIVELLVNALLRLLGRGANR